MNRQRYLSIPLLVGFFILSIPAVAFAQEATIQLSGNKAVISIPSISNGTVAIVNIGGEDEFTIRSLELGAANRLEQIEVTIEILEEKPGGLGDVNGTVYQYLMITTSNLGTEDILFAKLNFGIPKTWMEDNGVEKTTVGVLGIFEEEWSIVSSTQELEDTAEEVIFTAELPHLSFLNYAVAGKLPTVTTTATETTTKTTTITTDTATITTTSTPVVTATVTTVVQGENTIAYVAIGVAAVAVVILLVVFRSSRKT